MNDVQRKYNLKSPGVKRLMREAAELREPTEQYYAQPLEDNLFEWHFTVRGPADTEFSEGKYHGRITLPPEYPMKPPSIILLTPNGRFELGKKICLSMSAHHPETWQPSWSIRTVLLALIGFMPSQGAGAIGSLDYTPEERKVLAKKSQIWKCETCSMDHSDCLLEVNPEKDTSGEMDEAKELAAQISFKGEAEKGTATKPTNEVPNPQQGAALQFQREFQQFMQNMQRQPGFPGNFQFPLPPMQQNNFQNIPPVNNSASSNNAQPAATTGPVTTQTTTPRPTTTPASDSNIRQRNVNQINTENVNTNINSTASQPRATELNTRRSFLDTITLWLLYIVTFLLVALIIRRLALEKTGITKD